MPSASPRYLVVSNAYPRSDALYRYQFLHARVKAYLREGLPVDVYCVDGTCEAPSTYEFEGVTVHTGDPAAFEAWLEDRSYTTYLVHFPMSYMLDPIERQDPEAGLVLWLHGYEVQAWWRRWFNYLDDAELTPTAMESQRLHAQARVDYLRALVVRRPDAHVVTVSEWFRSQSVEPDLGLTLPSSSVIPNFVDGALFKHVAKPDDQSARVLVVRPFTTRKYAGKEIVDTILRVSAETDVPVHFTVRGDGENFDALTAPLLDLPNVDVRRGYLTQAAIAELHRHHGVLLNPSYWDSQGVSSGEAMSSGLVPVTSGVAAIPEFVEHGVTGFLLPPRDVAGMADAIMTLAADPRRFGAMSRAAAASAQAQCGWDATIAKEIELIRGPLPAGRVDDRPAIDWRRSYEDLTAELTDLLLMAKSEPVSSGRG